MSSKIVGSKPAGETDGVSSFELADIMRYLFNVQCSLFFQGLFAMDFSAGATQLAEATLEFSLEIDKI